MARDEGDGIPRMRTRSSEVDIARPNWERVSEYFEKVVEMYKEITKHLLDDERSSITGLVSSVIKELASFEVAVNRVGDPDNQSVWFGFVGMRMILSIAAVQGVGNLEERCQVRNCILPLNLFGT